MHYEDLTAYDYFDADAFRRRAGEHVEYVSFRPDYARQNVGWLEAGQPYPTGPVPEAFVEKLAAVQAVQWMNVCRGFHVCDLCPWGEGPTGNGEIRIPGEPGAAFAAPFLIGHYIGAHAYSPPQAFVDAVMAVDLDAWAAAEVPFPWIPGDARRV
ncbi:hypothetical protein [Streptomyces sp. RG80]|uniref:DUF7919 family protein n=1 Tax=Streptomyces sp. RG80 TaxID=3157340 RepID=UPI00338EFB64